MTRLRDFAVLTVLARLGLRAGELTGLELGDVDWHSGEVIVRGKGGRQERLPLPVDVGRAVVAYLRRGRPLRHSFAVRTLIDGYRTDADVAARLPLLSTYLGHVHPARTYWYLSAAPELLALAGKRLERSLEEPS